MYTATTLHLYDSSSAKDIASYLSDNLVMGDYYSERGKTAGTWSGNLIPDLAVDTTAPVTGDSSQFLNLLRGKHPSTGDDLKYRAAKKGAVAGYDFVVDPDKSVSVMAMFDKRIIDAHETANALAMAEIEKNASRRIRTGDVNARTELPNQFTGNFLSCSFTHDLSRANDPQLHTHNFIFNITKGEDGKYYALDQKEMRRSIRYFSHIYNTILARELEELGYETEASKKNGRIVSFRLAGVSKKICETYSERSREIAAEALIYQRERELDRALTVSERDVIARSSRDSKSHLSDENKIMYARSKVSPEEWSSLTNLFVESTRRGATAKSADMSKCVTLAVEHLFERRSAVSLREVASEVMVENFGFVDFSAITEYLSSPENLAKHGLLDIESQTELPEHERCFTTLAALGREQQAIEFVNESKDKRLAFNTEFQAFSSPEQLSEEENGTRDYSAQRSVVHDVLASTDVVINIRGKAGTGKTTMLAELVHGVTDGGGSVYMLAPTHTAKDELIDEGFPARTVSSFLLDERLSDLYGKTIIVDEAGLLSASQGAELLDRAKRCGARLIFVGDTRQHSSVEAGDFIRGLEVYSDISTFELNAINRQIPPKYKEAVEVLSEGRGSEGLGMIDDLGWMVERSDYLGSAVEELRAGDFENSKNILFVAPTNAEVDELNRLARERIKSLTSGALSDERVRTVFRQHDMTESRLRQAVNFSPGDVVEITVGFNGLERGSFHTIASVDTVSNKLTLDDGTTINTAKRGGMLRVGETTTIAVAVGECVMTTANDRRLSLVNGEALTVRDIDEAGNLTCVNRKGVEKTVPADFAHLRYGYAVTSHKAQGRTVDKVVVAARRLDSSAAYVAISRGRRSCVVHTPSKDDLISLAGSSERPLAMEAFDRGALREGMRNEALKAEELRRSREQLKNASLDRDRVREIEEWYSERENSRAIETSGPSQSLYSDIPQETLEAFQKYSEEYLVPLEELIEGYRKETLGISNELDEDMGIGF